MNHSIVGTGSVGQALAKAFARKGIEVALASRRSPDEIAPIAKAIGPSVVATTVPEALRAEYVFLAMPFGAYEDVAKAVPSWEGKTVIDATNAYGVPPESLGDRPSSAVIAETMPGARLVKGFNQLPARTLAEDPETGGGRRVVFLSSDDEDAADEVAALAERLGFAPVGLGRLDEGGWLVQARGDVWAPLIFQELLKREAAK